MEKYRLAGELFGLLRKELGFGVVRMFSLENHSVVFEWSVSSKRGKHYAQEAVSLEQLTIQDHLESFAHNMASSWKLAFQNKIESNRTRC